MAGRSANLTNAEALAAFRASLLLFEEGVQESLTMLEIEGRRPIDWIDNDRGMYWPRELNKASDGVAEARVALERCELTISEDSRKSCYDEKKAFEKAKRRLRTAEAKVIAVRKWKVQVHKEVEEFKVAIAKLKLYLDCEFLASLASLERIITSIDSYLQRGGPALSPSSLGNAPASSSPEASSESSPSTTAESSSTEKNT